MGLFLFGNKGRREEQEAQFRRRIEEQLSKLIEGREEEQRLLDALSGGVRQAGADIRKHNMALEDCLDVLEEQQEAETQKKREAKKKTETKDIAETQRKVLEEELDRTGVTIEAVMERYQIERLEDMTPEIYEKALQGLKKTKTKAA